MKRLAIFLLCCLFVVSSATAGPPGSPIGGAGGGGSGDMTKAVYDSGDDGVVDSAIATAVQDNLVVNADINSSAAIDATKIADGTVTSTEFQYLGDVTSAIQAQMDDKAPLVSPSLTTPSLGVAAATTLNTGQGAYELYAMDQNVQTADNVAFNKVTSTEGVVIGQSATEAGYSRLFELSGNGTNYFEFVAEDDLSATVSVTVGEAQVDFGALNLVTTGTLSAGVVVLDNVASPTAAQSYGSLNIVNAAITVTLPAAAAGMSTCVLSVAAAAVSVDVDGADVIYLNGTALDAGDKVTSASAAGDFICLVSSGTTNWYTLGRSGTWTDGGV